MSINSIRPNSGQFFSNIRSSLNNLESKGLKGNSRVTLKKGTNNKTAIGATDKALSSILGKAVRVGHKKIMQYFGKDAGLSSKKRVLYERIANDVSREVADELLSKGSFKGRLTIGKVKQIIDQAEKLTNDYKESLTKQYGSKESIDINIYHFNEIINNLTDATRLMDLADKKGIDRELDIRYEGFEKTLELFLKKENLQITEIEKNQHDETIYSLQYKNKDGDWKALSQNRIKELKANIKVEISILKEIKEGFDKTDKPKKTPPPLPPRPQTKIQERKTEETTTVHKPRRPAPKREDFQILNTIFIEVASGRILNIDNNSNDIYNNYLATLERYGLKDAFENLLSKAKHADGDPSYQKDLNAFSQQLLILINKSRPKR